MSNQGSLGDLVRSAIAEGTSKRRVKHEETAESIGKEVDAIVYALPTKCRMAAADGVNYVEVMKLDDNWCGSSENDLQPVARAVFHRLKGEGLDVFINFDMSGNWSTHHTLGLRLG